MFKPHIPAVALALFCLLFGTQPTLAQSDSQLSLSISPWAINSLLGRGPGPVASIEVARMDLTSGRELGLSASWFHLAEVRDLVILQPGMRFFRDGTDGWYLSTLLRFSKQHFYDDAEIDGQVFQFAETAAITKAGIGMGVGWRWQSDGPLFWNVGPLQWNAEANLGLNLYERMDGDRSMNNERAWGLENGDVFLDLTFMRLGWTF